MYNHKNYIHIAYRVKDFCYASLSKLVYKSNVLLQNYSPLCIL